MTVAGQIVVRLPENARIGSGSRITADVLSQESVFRRFRSVRLAALTIGRRSLLQDVTFNVGEDCAVEIGDDCLLDSAFLIGERSLKIGNRVTLSWHATLIDSDFHPIDFEARLLDSRTLSPEGRSRGTSRPAFASLPVVIQDDVWVGANAMILKGVTIGAGALVEPGAVVTRDVAPGARVIGNPARPIDGIDR